VSQHVRKADRPTVIGTERRPASAVPRPPVALDGEVAVWWRMLWRTPVAAAWTLSDHALVLVLARCLARLDHETTPGVAGQVANIAAQLGLTPRARRVLTIQTEPEPRPAARSGRLAYRLAAVD
jgi:hypothetical protein